jgi:hypothetical protein
VATWVEALEGDEDRTFLQQGVLHGFQLIPIGADIGKSFTRNHRSAIDNAAATTDIILDEIHKGRYVVCSDWMPDIISPLGLVPKSSGGFRLIYMTVVYQSGVQSMISQ